MVFFDCAVEVGSFFPHEGVERRARAWGSVGWCGNCGITTIVAFSSRFLFLFLFLLHFLLLSSL